jgi:nitrogen fixation protein FixH
MAMGMSGFFAIVIAVNLLMAMAASRTFGGTVVDNSYIASQRFNHWLDQAEAAKKLGWSVELGRRDGHALIRLGDRAGALSGASVRAVAHHPLGRLPDIVLGFDPGTGGDYQSRDALPPGRWQLRIEVQYRSRRTHFLGEVPA